MFELFKKIKHPIEYYKELSVPAKAGIWFLICSFLQKGMSAITTPIFTRLLTTAEYGEVSVFYSWADILHLFITFGLSSSVFARGLVQHEDNKNDYTSIMLTLVTTTTCISFIVFVLLHKYVSLLIKLPLIGFWGIYLYAYFSAILEFWYQEKRVSYSYQAFVFLTLSLTIIKPIASIATIKLFENAKVVARIAPDIILSSIVGIILLFIMMNRGKRFYDKFIWKESMIYVLPLIPHYLSQRVLSQSDRIMIADLIGDSQAGIYSLAYSVGMLLTLLNTALDSTISPWAFRKIKQEKYRAVGELSETLMFFFGLCVISFSLIAPELTRLFATKDYYEAIYIIPIIAISSYFIFMYVQFIYFEYYSGKTKYIMIATVCSALINLLLNYVFIKQYGYVAAAYTTLFCYIMYAVGHYFIMNRICKKHFRTSNVFNAKKIFGMSVGFIVATFLSLWLVEMTMVRIVTASIVILLTLYYGLQTVKKFGLSK